MSLVTTAQVLAYVAGCAESIIEDDMNESGTWTDEQFEELTSRALNLCFRLQLGVSN